MQFPENFSFIETPDETLESLWQFMMLARDGAKAINVSQVNISAIDYCANSVLAALALEARASLQTRFRGQFPTNLEVLEIIVATGLPKVLGVTLPNLPKFRTLPLIHGGKSGTALDTSSSKEKTAENLVDFLARCVGDYGARLTRDARRRFFELLGEVLANAEDHSGRGDWYVAAYMRRPSPKSIGDCHVVIFSFGQTIEKSLTTLPLDAELRTQIESLVEDHSRRRLLHRDWTAENLWTLYALQEGVTRYYSEVDRGHGTAEMIQAFQDLGRSSDLAKQPRMCIVSGRTYILFDGTHSMKLQRVPSGQERRIIAFNTENDLRKPPDAGYIRSLEQTFPGTLISMRFYLDSEYLTGTPRRNE